jgi:hypothetical protein
MKRRVIITALPKAQSGLDVKMQGLKAGLGLNANTMPWAMMVGKMSEPGVEVNSTLKPVPWDQANLEAEQGEVAVLPTKSGIPNTFKIGGKRHSEGGTPLNLQQDAFIYSDTKDMRIKDPKILAQFGITQKGSYTPASIAKKYDINKFKQILAQKDSDDIQRKTAEGMITNYNLKLAKLALLQESMKGFPTGIPVVAMPYIESQGIDPAQFIQANPQPGQAPTADDQDQMKFGGIIAKLKQAQSGGVIQDYFQKGGNNQVVQPRAKDRVILNPSTGQYEVFNWAGKKIGIMNMPPQRQQIYQQPQVVNPGGGGTQGQGTTVSTTTSTTTTKKDNIPADAIVIKRSEYGTEEDYIAARNTAYTNNPGKTIYTQPAEGGSYSKVVVTKGAQPGTQQEHLSMITQNFSDPQVKQALYDKTLAAYDQPGTLGKTPGFTKEDIIALGPDGVANHFIEMQTRNLESNALLQKAGVDYSCFDNTTGKLKNTAECKDSPYKSLDDVFAQTSVGAPKDNQSKGIQQMSYIGYNDLIQDNRSGKITDEELSTKLDPFGVSQFGVSDEELKTKGVKGTISKADTYYTNTTSGQVASYGTPDSYSEEALPGEEVTEGAVTTKANHLQPPSPDLGSPWWLQDIIKTAHAAGNLARVKKYMPWQATPGVVTPEVTFYDPNRELAANAEQSNIAAQTLAQFTGPQSFNARNAQVQGQAMKNAADINSRYNNLNVGISNQQANQNAGIMNQAMQQRAALATGLWDKYQTVNQQFDVSKSQARDALVNQYVNAITNKNYTANLNKMNPQFAVDPSVGGEYYFHDPRALKPDFSQQPTADDYYEQMLKEHPTWRGSDAGLKMAWDAAKLRSGIQPTGEDAFLEYQQNRGITPQMSSYPGGQG